LAGIVKVEHRRAVRGYGLVAETTKPILLLIEVLLAAMIGFIFVVVVGHVSVERRSGTVDISRSSLR